MAGAAGIAIRGAGKALLKGKVKPKPSYPKPRGTPTKAGLVARRNALRGETTAEKYRKALGPTPKGVKAPTPPSIKKTAKEVGKGIIIAGVAYAAGKAKATKEAKAKEGKQKLKEATEEHKKKTKEKREKYGKHHG